MNARRAIQLLAAVCLVESVLIGVLLYQPGIIFVGQKTEVADLTTPVGSQPANSVPNPATAIAEMVVTPAELTKRNTELETELAEVTKELDLRKSEISFSYGSVRDSGRFVGMTFRKMFEAAAAREATEAQARMVDNQINILSLGPFIQDAEVMESDPGIFAQFQAPLISEVLGIPPQRATEVEMLLEEIKIKSLKVEPGSPEWVALNDSALNQITALLPDDQKLARKEQINFFQQYGVLMIPAYSILRAPAPTVVTPAKTEN